MKEKALEQKFVGGGQGRPGYRTKVHIARICGVPDRLHSSPAEVAFVEVKAPGEKPRPLQDARHRLLRRLGFKVYVLDDKRQIGGMLDEIQFT